MNCPIILPFATITPDRLVAYLAAHGWHEATRPVPEDSGIYLKGKGGREIEILVPLHREWGDYEARIQDAIGAIAADEQGCCKEVFERVADVAT